MCSIPDAMHSSTAYWISGFFTTRNISFGMAFVAGRNRVPKPATGNTALRTFLVFAVIFPAGNYLDLLKPQTNRTGARRTAPFAMLTYRFLALADQENPVG